MKNKVKSIFNRKDLKVLSTKETKKIKGGNSSSGSSSTQDVAEIVIQDIIQI